jgi:uncharacterized protein (DUF1697 family)
MSKYISLLRGINVGGRYIKMADIVACYSDLGLRNIKTYLQSGNVSFDCDAISADMLKQKLESAISKRFNYPAKIFLFSKDKIEQIIDECPFDTSDNTFHYYVILTNEDIATELYRQGVDLNSIVESITLGNSVVYWKVPKGMTLTSSFSKLLTKSQFRDFHTNRNLRTLLKMV